jgi:CheY-like chemotaxis protein
VRRSTAWSASTGPSSSCSTCTCPTWTARRCCGACWPTRTAQVPVVVVSADVNSGHIERVLAAGAREYLTKPLDVARFRTVVDGLLASVASRP